MNRIYSYALLGLLLAGYGSSAQGIRIMNGTTFKLTGGTCNLVLSNNASLENNAPVRSSQLVLKATGTDNSQLKGSGDLDVAQVQVNKVAGQNIVLQKDIGVADGVYFTTGLLDLNGHDLVLADTALLVNETNASRITGAAGAVQITRNLDAPLAENPGNLGLVITSGADWGSTQIRRSPGGYTNPAGGGNSMNRSFEVTPANNTGLNAFLRMYYLDGELNGLDESALEFFKSDDNGINWNNIGSVSRNTTQNFVNINGVQTMSLFTLSSTGNALPLEFSDVRSVCTANRVSLQWTYGHVLPGACFRVDKSRDGMAWQRIADKIKAELSLSYLYHYTDEGDPYPYYRLQYVTPDGTVSYSPVEEVNCKESGYAFSLLQNPVGDRVRILVQTGTALDICVRVYDLQGRLMLQEPERNISSGVSHLDIDVSGIAPGMYLVKVGNARSGLWQVKFVK